MEIIPLRCSLSISPSYFGIPAGKFNKGTVFSLFGQPDNTSISPNHTKKDEVEMLHYSAHKLCFYTEDEQITCFSVHNPNFLLEDFAPIGKSEKQLIETMAQYGFKTYEIDSDFGEKQLIFEEVGITVFFDNQLISEVFIDILNK